ncbi:trypsin-like cysteine/serine peptidase domain-containing protein [Aspergillus karnatakaensis]|uniref:serine protease n=1 Tax=Aspergillus karnatakaensis TaxID=1810916 RepID=UPI003CCD09D6
MKFHLLTLSILSTIPQAHSIIGGTDVPIQEYPYQVSIFVRGTFAGGGSILSPNTILTAAHCVSGASVDSFTVRSGSSARTSGGTLLEVESITIHPQYNQPVALENDIALITLAENLTFTEEIQPIALPEMDGGTRKVSETPETEDQVVISGWGAVNEGKTYSATLRAVTVDVLNSTDCAAAYEDYAFAITEGMFCAGVEGGGMGTCQGDSGGPVVADGVVVGIVSWEIGCAREESPAVDTRVAHYRDWIAEVTGI